MGRHRVSSDRLDGKWLVPALRRLVAGSAGDPAGPDPVLCRDPVFLLSAGWRSGSTLAQRLVASGGRTLVWGEPFGDHLPIHRLCQMLEPFAVGDVHAKNDIERFEGALSESWIANLNPGLAAMRRAHLAWFETLFAQPAHERGYPRWGCKWVRLSADHAHYLRWLYPEAKLVFLVRHPLDALRSYLGEREVWYFLLPEHGIRSSHDFLEHWRRLAGSFLSEHQALDAMLLRYEDLVGDGDAPKRLAAHLHCAIDPGVIGRNIGSSAARGRVPVRARLEVRLRLAALLRRLGYQPGGGVRGPGPGADGTSRPAPRPR